ncbi:MAG: helix-turn-helix domain-containing protein [Clostridiales bacterium]|nr:helix-turn-helix domain-containing protein [Clostridiales bacterium]
MGYTCITVKDLQKKLGVGRNKAYEIIKMPGCPSVDFKGSIRIVEELFDEWVSTMFPKPAPAPKLIRRR